MLVLEISKTLKLSSLFFANFLLLVCISKDSSRGDVDNHPTQISVKELKY